MGNLNNIPKEGIWATIVDFINDNFNKLWLAIESLTNSFVNQKGYFETLSDLKAAYPTPRSGDQAFVLNNGKYLIYKVTNGVWTATTQEAPLASVDLASYAKKEEIPTDITKTGGSTKTAKDLEDGLVQLAGKTAVKYPLNGNYPFSSFVKKEYREMLVDAYIDFEYEEGYDYAFSTISRVEVGYENAYLNLYRHKSDVIPATAESILLKGSFWFSHKTGKLYVYKSDKDESFVVVDWTGITVSQSNVYEYDGWGLSKSIFKNNMSAVEAHKKISSLSLGIENTTKSVNNIQAVFDMIITSKLSFLDFEKEVFYRGFITSIFSGWGMWIGPKTNFNSATVMVYNRGSNTENIKKVRITIRGAHITGNILLDKYVDVDIPPGTKQEVTAIFQEEKWQNVNNINLKLEYRADQTVDMWQCATVNPYQSETELTTYSVNGEMNYAQVTSTSNATFYYYLSEARYSLSDKEVAYLRNRLNYVAPDENIQKEVEVVLPDKIYSVVGDTLQLFYRGIVKAVNPYNYDILVSCSRGRQFPRYFEFTPTVADVGQHTFKLSVKDNLGNVLHEKTSTLIVKNKAVSPASLKTVLNIGDSLTSAGIWVKEAYRRLTAADGQPKGDSLTNITFKGRKTDGTVGWEGTGGWKWEDFTTAGREANRFYVTGVQVAPAMDAVYTHNGQDYTVAEINITGTEGNLRMIYGTNPLASGVLTKKSGAGDTTINFTSVEPEAGNPFWNSATNQLDIKAYVDKYCGGKLDTVVTLLSWNGQTAHRTNFDAIKTEARKLFDHIHSVFPECKILLMGLQLPSLNGGMGMNYGATGTGYADAYGMVVTAFNQNKAYQELANEAAYSSFVKFVNVSMQFDSENNMAESDRTVNVRSTKTEKRGTNGVHPPVEGYLALADCPYRAIVCEVLQ